jgi:hypothetical protein
MKRLRTVYRYTLSVFIPNSCFNLITTWIKLVETVFVLILASMNPAQHTAHCLSAKFIFRRKADAKGEFKLPHVCSYVGTEKRD